MLKPFIINNLKTVKLNFGPQHPAAHGVLRLIVNLDGEIISEVDPHIGFLHRGTEKLLEFKTYSQGLPYFDRLDYVSVLNYEHAFSLAIEKLLNYDIPIRASFIRVIFSELTRLLNHLMSITTHAMDVGAITPFLFGFEERERIMEFYERVSGARMHANYIRVGGVAFDLPIGVIDDIYEFVLKFIKRINEIDEILTENKIWLERLQNVGVITYENVLNFGFSGVIARSVGINSDLRKKTPYEIYDKVSFDIPMSYRGDCYDRYVLRMKEMRESCKIILQLLDLPFGPIKVLKDKSVNVSKNDLIDMESVISHYKFFTYGYQCPSNIVYSAVEAPKGEFGVSVVSKNSNKPYRCSLNRPGFKHCAGLNVLSKGYSLTDMVTIVGTLDLVLGEIDC